MTSRKSNDKAAAYMNEARISVQRNVNRSFSEQGSKFINDTSTSAHVDEFYAIQGINNCTLDFTSGAGTQCLVGPGMIDYDANFVIPNGVIIYGDFRKITLAAAGSCIAYSKGNP
jgi:hypothetical protein